MTDRDLDITKRAEARLGTVLRGKYRLDRVLGIGGMAVVYKATHRNQAQFAVKMLHPEVSLSADIRSRFLREGYAANSIKHPGAVLQLRSRFRRERKRDSRVTRALSPGGRAARACRREIASATYSPRTRTCSSRSTIEQS